MRVERLLLRVWLLDRRRALGKRWRILLWKGIRRRVDVHHGGHDWLSSGD